MTKTEGKTAYVTARIEPKLKKESTRVLNRLGLSTADAITLFFKQITLQKGMPFEIRIPNKKTKATLSDNGKHDARYENVEEMMKDVWPNA
jgi:addiction module RelB/DinJ family antitoxin